MSAQILITDTKEIKVLKEKIKDLKLDLADRRKLLESIGVEVESQTEERFENQRDVSGSKWQDISAKTKAYYNKKGISGSILNRTRQLRDTIESQAADSQVLVGAVKIYAATHNYGDKKRNIPQREFLGLSSQNIVEIEYIINDFLENIIKEAGN